MPFLINPFLGAAAGGLVPVDLSSGTIYGDMDEGAAETAAFDGVTGKTAASCAAKNGGTNAYISRILPAPKIFGQAVIFGSSDQGFVPVAGRAVTLRIRGKNSAPSNHNDGSSTILGSVTFTDGTDESAGRLIASTDLTTAWAYIWPHFEYGSGAGQNTDVYCAQFQLWEWVP